ncbi:MAG TPA: PQQ-dependent dehydrogenase, methanol/ethanol family, partial [Novosphingobium sp.]|nr:PQQ-dependent dehydrogenase, methanol/ethanol family [Novosphingobium sp.]
RALDAPASVGDWMSYGRGWDEQRYSPLTDINERNVGQLGLAWYADLNTYRGIEGTPLVVDGVLYNISVFNVVTAYDARNGQVLWTFDPKVEPQWARLACCGPSSRGIAAWQGKIYIGALDGRLIAVDAKTGKQAWSVQTFDKSWAYSITGAPRVFDGKVVIGNGGADYGVRGFVSAYDAATGKKLWRFYLAPGDPAKGPDGEASDSVMAMAAKTWNGQWWKMGGGGTAWDSIVYDPKLDLVYIGTGNGGPHVQHFRSPQGGDNLFLCSIVAVNAKTGQYVWHYQMVPEEEWDYTCTQPMMLADLTIGGRQRQVIMQAPKNGFFYVLDRKTGQVISGKSYVPNTWASGLDPKTGRPLVYPDAHITEKPHLMSPSWMAAHSWYPMAFSPKTGLVYFPAQEQGDVYARLSDDQFKWVPFRSNSGRDFGSQPELRKALLAQANAAEKGYLLAWNPVTQTEAFRVPYPYPGNGGVLATAGNLLVEGTIEKKLAIYRADNGKLLWQMPVDNVAVAGPITYRVDGVQYIAVNVGWTGSPVFGLSKIPGGFRTSPSRLLVFRLGGKAQLPPMPPPSTLPAPPWLRAGEAEVKEGQALYAQTCRTCHGEEARGGVKDLRFMSAETHKQFLDIVLGGARSARGMASFKDLLSPSQAEAIHSYLIARANEDWQDQVGK